MQALRTRSGARIQSQALVPVVVTKRVIAPPLPHRLARPMPYRAAPACCQGTPLWRHTAYRHAATIVLFVHQRLLIRQVVFFRMSSPPFRASRAAPGRRASCAIPGRRAPRTAPGNRAPGAIPGRRACAIPDEVLFNPNPNPNFIFIFIFIFTRRPGMAHGARFPGAVRGARRPGMAHETRRPGMAHDARRPGAARDARQGGELILFSRLRLYTPQSAARRTSARCTTYHRPEHTPARNINK